MQLGAFEHCGPEIFRFVEVLLRWNRKMNLVGDDNPESLFKRHVMDGLYVANKLGKEPQVVDVGSGGGFPGLVVGIARKDLLVTLVERRSKRAAFLRHAGGELGLANVAVEFLDGQELAGRKGGSFDQAVSRAAMTPVKWLKLGSSLVKGGGLVWVLSSCLEGTDLGEGGTTLSLDRRFEYTLPDGRKRVLTALRRS